jgi:hypothetical protein
MTAQSGAGRICLSVKTLRIRVPQPGSSGPVDIEALLRFTRAAISDQNYSKKHTSKATESCVLNANEEKRSIVASPPYHGLRTGSDVTDGALLRGSSREPVSDTPTQIVCSRRAVDRAPRPKRGRRNRRDWAYCYSGFARLRRTIFGGAAAAHRDNRPHTTTERLLPGRLSRSGNVGASHRNKSVTTGVTSLHEPKVNRKGPTRRENR